MLTWVTGLICLLTGGKPAYNRKEHLHRAIMMVKNVNVKNSDNICWQIYLYVQPLLLL